MTWSPSSLNINENINEEDPDYMKIVANEKDFCKLTYFWGLITYPAGTSTLPTPINEFLENTVKHQLSGTTPLAFTPKLGTEQDFKNCSVLKAIDNFMDHFDTPMKIIKCSDPDEYIYGVKSLCDGLFTYYVKKMGRDSRIHKYNVIVLDLMNKLNNEIPFKGDNDANLATFLTFIQSYITSAFNPAQHMSELDSTIKAVIYATYYPYFTLLYILSFIPTADKKNRSDLTFITTRKARLACYMYIAHIASILNKALIQYVALPNLDSTEKKKYEDKQKLMQQIMGNVSLNIIGKESIEFSTKQDERTIELDKLSSGNMTMNKQILSDNERYERYKQNLISAANNEKSIDNQLKNAATWMFANIWILIGFSIVILVLLFIPKDKIPHNYDTQALYIVCGSAMLYTLIMGIIAAIRMLR